jgi:hypothetical protein
MEKCVRPQSLCGMAAIGSAACAVTALPSFRGWQLSVNLIFGTVTPLVAKPAKGRCGGRVIGARNAGRFDVGESKRKGDALR